MVLKIAPLSTLVRYLPSRPTFCHQQLLRRSEGCRANAFGLLTDLATSCRSNVAVLINLLLRHHSSSSPCQPPTATPATAAGSNPLHPSVPSGSDHGNGNGTGDGDGDGDNSTAAAVAAGTATAAADTTAEVASGGNGGGGGFSGGSNSVERVSWSYAPRQTDKAECGYVGLQNLGATCYMNSLLQQLFMVPALRFGVLSCDPFFRSPEQDEKGEEMVPQEENLLYQLQVCFRVCWMCAFGSWLLLFGWQWGREWYPREKKEGATCATFQLLACLVRVGRGMRVIFGFQSVAVSIF